MRDLGGCGRDLAQFCYDLRRLADGDLEKIAQRIYSYAVKECEYMLSYANVSRLRLHDLKYFMRSCCEIAASVRRNLAQHIRSGEIGSVYLANLVSQRKQARISAEREHTAADKDDINNF